MLQLDRKTKIIATFGPACSDPKVLASIIKTGVDVIRLNASHQADPEIIKNQVKLIRKCAQEVEKPVGILLDLQGPKIRVGKFENGKIELKKGDKFILTTEHILGTAQKASVSYANLVSDVEVGQPLFIDDGKVPLMIDEKNGNEIICTVQRDGIVSNHKGINLPLTKLSVSALTAKDREDVKLSVENELDYVALSFVSTADDVNDLRALLTELGGENLKIISKIERQFALDNILSIIDASDAIMVARGDLGVEIGIENVPKSQKWIIRESNKRLKPVIVATQMLETMITSETATRAEVSDVANAIYDRCDAVMLSGETAVGINPLSVIRTMVSICEATDKHMVDIKLDHIKNKSSFLQQTIATSCCKAADEIAQEIGAKIIMAFTSSGNTPLIASKLNPAIPIIAPTDDHRVCQRMALYRGVIPLLLPKKYEDIHRWTDMIGLSIKKAKENQIIQVNDLVVVTAGIPIGQSNGINSIRVVTVH